jgi:hypothetical protein
MKTHINANSENGTAAPRTGLVRAGSKTFKHRHERRKIREQLRRVDSANRVEDESFT